MILEIEYYKGDVKLHGKRLDKHSLRRLLNNAEGVLSGGEDLAELLFRCYGFEKIVTDEIPNWIYDRDTGSLYAPKG